MKIKEIELYKYSLALTTPLSIKGKGLNTREGLILHIKSEQNIDSFGEVAPLPFFSKETLNDAIEQIQRIKPYLTSEDIPEGLEKLDGGFNNWLGGLKLLPSVQFGIETAILSLLANSQNVTLGHFIATETHDKVRINGLLQGSLDNVIDQAKELKLQGFRDMKLKVGSDVSDDVAKVKAINKILEGKALLHLDANQSWDIKTAIEFGNQIGCAAVDYIEEPLNNPDEIPNFFDTTLIPVALDESVQAMNFKDIQALEGVDVIVLKPTLLGGIEKTWELIKNANKQAIEVVISSAFESSLGILTLANLAGASTTRDRNAGLDTLKWFQKDILKDKITFDHGKIDISQRKITAQDINFDILEKV